MKIRIIYSQKQKLYIVQKKRFLSSWETLKHYFFTDSQGDIQDVKGFTTYKSAEDWVSSRYENENIVGPKDKGKFITSD